MAEPRSVAEVVLETPVVGQSDAGGRGRGGGDERGGGSRAERRPRDPGRALRPPRGMASGGMVLVLDDMVNGDEVTTTGIVRGHRGPKLDLAVSPPPGTGRGGTSGGSGARWGCHDFRAHGKPQPIVYAVAFDPDGWKRVSNDLIAEAGVNLRPLVVRRGDRRGRPNPGVIVETKAGRQALLGSSSSTRPATSTSRAPARPTSTARTSSPPCSGWAGSTPTPPSGSRSARWSSPSWTGGPPGPRRSWDLWWLDAAPRHRVVQLPAPDRPSMRSRSRT